MKGTYQRHLGDVLDVPKVVIDATTKSQADSVGPTNKHTKKDLVNPFNDEDAVELVGQKYLHAKTTAREHYESIPQPLETAYLHDRLRDFSVHRDMERSDDIV